MNKGLQRQLDRKIKAALRQTPETAEIVIIGIVPLSLVRVLTGQGWGVISAPANASQVWYLEKNRAQAVADLSTKV